MFSAHAVAHIPTEDSAYLSAYEHLDAIVVQLTAPDTQQMTHSQLEMLIEKEGRELLRRLLQAHLDERSASTVNEKVVGADQKERTHRHLQTRHLETIFGSVQITREGYGGPGLESLHPLDGELNLPADSFSHTVRRQIAEACSKESFDEAIETIKTHTGATVAKRQAQELATRAAPRLHSILPTAALCNG